MDVPVAPPYGDLFERARKSRHITIQRAAESAGIVKQTWIDIVKGRTARPKPGTLAGMARAVYVSPERLEAEGGQGEAADILREMLRESPDLSPPPSPAAGAPLRQVPSLPAVDLAGPAEEVLRYLMTLYPDDRMVRLLGGDEDESPEDRVHDILELLAWRRSKRPRGNAGNGTSG
jgi:transcriptional regulator with XRE-family HTH domain